MLPAGFSTRAISVMRSNMYVKYACVASPATLPAALITAPAPSLSCVTRPIVSSSRRITASGSRSSCQWSSKSLP